MSGQFYPLIALFIPLLRLFTRRRRPEFVQVLNQVRGIKYIDTAVTINIGQFCLLPREGDLLCRDN